MAQKLKTKRKINAAALQAIKGARKQSRSSNGKEDSPAQRVTLLMDDIKTHAIRQDDLIEAVMLGALTRLHVLFIGPPGCNKTGVIDAFVNRITGATIFKTTLNKYSEPDALLGMFDLQAFRNNQYKRVQKGSITNAHYAFLGEVFSANGATLQALNRVLNEREVEECGERRKLDLRCVFADTNYYPQGAQDAVYDRFMIRVPVGYIPSDDADSFRKMLRTNGDTVKHTIPIDEWDSLHEYARNIPMPSSVEDEVITIRQDLLASSVEFSDRRWKLGMHVLQASAVLRGATAVDFVDIYALRHVLWHRLKDRSVVLSKIEDYKNRTPQKQIMMKLEDAVKVFESAYGSGDAQKYAGAMSTLGDIAEELAEESALADIEPIIDILDQMNVLIGDCMKDGTKLQPAEIAAAVDEVKAKVAKVGG